MKNSPPQWADKFLQWYCRPDLLEEIQGDAYELYFRMAKESKRRADFYFIWNVIRFFRLKNIRKSPPTYRTNSITMFKSYLLIGFRNALRNGATSFINSFGLALGVAAAITIFIFADQFFNADDFHANRDRIYEITNIINRDNREVITGDTPWLLGPALQEEFPGIEKATRIETADGAVRYSDRVFSEYLWFVDRAFFEMFTFPFEEGDANALAAKNGLVITQPMAKKYFGDEPALNKTVSIKFGNQRTEDFTVTAVIELPANNTMYFEFLLTMEIFESLKFKDRYDWSYLTDATFVLMKPGHSIEEVSPQLGKYKDLQNQSSPEWMIEGFKVFPFDRLTKESYTIESNVVGPGHPQGVMAMGVIAFLLLLLACFNYMNISVATISTRLKEIGIRKVIGGQRRAIISQFITENMLLSASSVGLGLALSYFLLMPGLNSLIPQKIPFAFSSGATMTFFFTSLLIFIVLVSGVYPSVYISRFQPVTILKGREKFGQRSTFSRVLLTMQFILAFTTIVGCFVFLDNSFYLKNKDWGYDPHQNITIPVNNVSQYRGLRDKLSAEKNIASLAGSVNHIGRWNTRSSVLDAGERFETVAYDVGFGYMETMNLRLKEGRAFDRQIQSDQAESVIVNEAFVKSMGWTTALDQTFESDSVKRHVIGVVQNFHYDDFYREILPVMFSIAKEDDFRYLSVKVEEGHVSETESLIRILWKEVAPDDPYEGMLQGDVFANFSNNNKTDMKILGFVAGTALVLACLGLFGLVSYNITRRLKEFSIRKVFGANVIQIFRLMNRDYVWILSISFAIGAPVGFFLMDNLIHHIYADPQPAGIQPFAIAIGLMVLTVAATVGSQMKRILRENPAKTLKNE